MSHDETYKESSLPVIFVVVLALILGISAAYKAACWFCGLVVTR